MNTSSLLQQIPNGITLSRMVIAAAFPFVPESVHITLIILGLLTEFLDGFIARTFNWTSRMGELLDPVADKLFVLSVCITWIWQGQLTLVQWLLLGTRDLGVLFICLVLLIKGQLKVSNSLPAQLPSKITTGVQYLVFIAVLTGYQTLIFPLVLVSAVFGVIATAHYVLLLSKSLRGAS